MIARMTSGVSLLALTQAHADWAQHLLLSPDEQIELLHKAARRGEHRLSDKPMEFDPHLECDRATA